MPTIVNFGRSPTVIGYGQNAYFGGPHFEDALVGNAELVSSTTTNLVLEDVNLGLRANFQGAFTLSGGEITDYSIKKITFFYFGEKFQVWKGLDWTDDDLEPVIDAYDDGDPSAISDFLNGESFRFILHGDAEDPGYQTLTEGDDRFIAKPSDHVSNEGITIFSFGGDDFIDLRARSETVDVNSGAGNDKILLGEGRSQVRSASGRDIIRGGEGQDNIDGQGGRDKIYGGAGDDLYLAGGRGNDRVSGGAGDDEIYDIKGKNRLFGDAGDDNITGRGWLSGGTGDDTIRASAHKITDTFDFRLRGEESYGRDKISGYFNPEHGAVDRLIFDVGTEFEYSENPNTMNMIIRTSLNGEDTGVVVISGGAYQADLILDAIDYM